MNVVGATTRNRDNVINVLVLATAVHAATAACGYALVDLFNRGVRCRVTKTSTSQPNVLADRLPLGSRLRVHPVALVRPALRCVLQSVLLLVVGGAFLVLDCPLPRMLVVAPLAVHKVTVRSAAILREFVKRFRFVAASAFLHLRSITDKYNEAIMRGWKVLRFTTDHINDGRAIQVIERAFQEARP